MIQQISSLKYYFDVEFTDGTTYTQNAEDRSDIDPEKRSCFYDVMQAIESGKKISLFTISNGANVFSVDLNDGGFIINDIKIFMHDRYLPYKDFQIIFYRDHLREFSNDGIGLSHKLLFCIGWKTSDEKGNEVKQIMQIE